MTEQPQANRPRRQYMDFAPRQRGTSGVKHSVVKHTTIKITTSATPEPAPEPEPTPTPAPSPAPAPAPKPVQKPAPATHVTTIKTHKAATIIVPKAIDEAPTATSVKTTKVTKAIELPEPEDEYDDFVSSRVNAFDGIPDEEFSSRSERHGIIAQLEDSSDFGIFGDDDNVIEEKPLPKNVFINTDKVDKRPLGSRSGKSNPIKNEYNRRSASKQIKDNVPTVVTSSPDKKNSIGLIIAAILIIIVGGIIGAAAYLILFQQ